MKSIRQAVLKAKSVQTKLRILAMVHLKDQKDGSVVQFYSTTLHLDCFKVYIYLLGSKYN